MISAGSIHATLIFSFSWETEHCETYIFHNLLWFISAGHAPTFLVSCVNHPSHVMFILILFNESTKQLCRIHKVVFSILIHLSPHPSQFLLSVFLIYSSKAHHKFSEHLQSDPCVRSSLKASRASAWPRCWFMTLSRSLSFAQHVSLWLLPV